MLAALVGVAATAPAAGSTFPGLNGPLAYEADGTASPNIFAIQPLAVSLGAGTRLTSADATDRDAAWSDDGRKIAFMTERDGNAEIYLMNADGSAQTRLPTDPAFDADPTLSPDGTRVAFNSTRDGNTEIYVMGLDGSAIFEHGGTVVSYMGDGVMGVFGAPVEQPDNAERAFAAGREMLDTRLPAFNDWLRGCGFGEGFRVGIGLCTGPVTSGNVGSARRLEYAAVGDTTNVAARLQEKNKDLGSQLLMAESTRVRLRVADSELVYVGEHPLAGRTGNVKVWGVASPADAAPRAAEPVRTGSP